MFLLEQLVPPVAVAAAVAVAWSVLALCVKDACASRALAPFAVGTGYFAGHIYIAGWTPLPPADTINWLPYFALAAAAIGWFACWLDSKAQRIALFGLACVGAMRLLLAPKFRYGWSSGEGWLWVGCLSCVVLLLTFTLTTRSRRPSIAMELPLLLIIVSTGTATALMLSGSLLLGQCAAMLSAALFGSLVLTWRGRTDGDGGAPVFSLVLVALIVCGYFFAELPALSAVLLAAAPAGAVIPSGISAPRWAAAARVAVVVAAVSGAVLAAFRSSPPWSDWTTHDARIAVLSQGSRVHNTPLYDHREAGHGSLAGIKFRPIPAIAFTGGRPFR